MRKRDWAILSLLVLFVALLVGWAYLSTDVNKKAQQVYANQTIELKTSLPTRIWLKIEEVHGTSSFIHPDVYLYGTLVIEAPDELQYNGATKTRTGDYYTFVINWTSSQGGETWFLEEYSLKVKDPAWWASNHAEIIPTNILVTYQE